LSTVVPTLRITDYAAAKRFFVDGLGFAIDWEWRHEPGFPVFLQISRDGMRLYLSEHEGDAAPGALVHLYVADVNAWQAEMLRHGIVAESPPIDQPWGNREMRVRDPDGNQLCVCTVIGGPSEPGEEGD